jgi:hypothetical protein
MAMKKPKFCNGYESQNIKICIVHIEQVHRPVRSKLCTAERDCIVSNLLHHQIPHVAATPTELLHDRWQDHAMRLSTTIPTMSLANRKNR